MSTSAYGSLSTSAYGSLSTSAHGASTTSALQEGVYGQYTQVEISIKCRGLKKMDWLSNTDPFCVVSITEPTTDDATGYCGRERHVSRKPSGRSVELGRTEVVRDTQNPDFCTTFKTNFVFEEQQTVIIRVFDEDKKGSTNLKKQSFVGSATLTLSELMNARGKTLKLPLEKKGFVIVHAEEVSSCNDELRLELAGSKLKNTDGMLGKSDPYFTISKMQEDGDYVHIFRSEVINDNLFPEWAPARLPLQKVCNGDLDRPLKIQIWDFDKNKKHEEIGVVDATVRKLQEMETFDVICDGVPFGRLHVRHAEVIEVPTLLDYLSGTCRMNFMAAVDLSSSNGDPASKDSLHFIDHRGFPNEYQAAIATVGGILQDYCSDMICHLFGYGMKEGVGLAPAHVFPVGDPSGLKGVDGILNAYKEHLVNPNYIMSEPTLLAPLIRNSANAALQRAEINEQEYTVLLIISDGGVNDLEQTIDEVCAAAEAPLSIVIVGVGDGDFSNMEKLDSDKEVLASSRGKKCGRDIVQFVPFRKFSACAPRLAAETLAEIPGQLVQYFDSKGIMPTPPAAPVVEEDIEWAQCHDNVSVPDVSGIAEASPMVFIDSTPLVEATAVEAITEAMYPAAGPVAAAAASHGSLPEPCSSTGDMPETYAEHHGTISSKRQAIMSGASTPSKESSNAASASSQVTEKQGRRHVNAAIRADESLGHDWVTKKGR